MRCWSKRATSPIGENINPESRSATRGVHCAHTPRPSVRGGCDEDTSGGEKSHRDEVWHPLHVPENPAGKSGLRATALLRCE
jgi:hypothetical protein